MGMPRIALVALVLSMLVTRASAGQRCIKRPQPVVMTADAQLDERGTWHRRVGDKNDAMKSGRISQAAVGRVERLVATATSEQVVRCLDALIADETSAAATKACTVKHAKR